jgi:hypothetical protein
MRFETRILFQETNAAALFEVRFPRVDLDEAEAALRAAIDGLATSTTPFHFIRTEDHIVGLVKLARWARYQGRSVTADDLRAELEKRLQAYFDHRSSTESFPLQAVSA